MANHGHDVFVPQTLPRGALNHPVLYGAISQPPRWHVSFASPAAAELTLPDECERQAEFRYERNLDTASRLRHSSGVLFSSAAKAVPPIPRDAMSIVLPGPTVAVGELPPWPPYAVGELIMPSYGDYRKGGPFRAPSMILVPGTPTEPPSPSSDPTPMTFSIPPAPSRGS